MEKISVYKRDWLEATADIANLDYGLLTNKKILIIEGNSELDKAVLDSFKYITNKHNLNIDIKVIKNEKNVDFILDTDRYDLVIYSGLCNIYSSEVAYKYVSTTKFLAQVFEKLDSVMIKKIVLLSDYRMYGKQKKVTKKSEYELLCNGSLENDEGTIFLKSLETTMMSFAKSQNASISILRAGIVIGADYDSKDNVFTNFIKTFVSKERCTIPKSKQSYSYIYISDLISAIIKASVDILDKKVYNACSNDDGITLIELTDILETQFPTLNEVEIINSSITDYESIMDNSLIKSEGWEPEISIKEAIQICGNYYIDIEYYKDYGKLYNGKLKEIQRILLNMLREVDKICKQNNIRYFLGGGTLLGAVRHQGFIPWDDDIDIIMLRDDYNKFCKIASKRANNKVFMQMSHFDKDNHFFSKVRLNNSILATTFTSKHMELHNGIFLDIFPHDKTSNKKLLQKMHLNATVLIRSMVFNKWDNTSINPEGKKTIIRGLANIIKNMMPLKQLEIIQYSVIRIFENKKDSKFLYDGMGMNLKKGAFPSSWFDDVEYIKFEGVEFPAPQNYKEYLTHLYGEYLEMPTLRKQTTKSNIVLIDLGEYGGH